MVRRRAVRRHRRHRHARRRARCGCGFSRRWPISTGWKAAPSSPRWRRARRTKVELSAIHFASAHGDCMGRRATIRRSPKGPTPMPVKTSHPEALDESRTRHAIRREESARQKEAGVCRAQLADPRSRRIRDANDPQGRRHRRVSRPAHLDGSGRRAAGQRPEQSVSHVPVRAERRPRDRRGPRRQRRALDQPQLPSELRAVRGRRLPRVHRRQAHDRGRRGAVVRLQAERARAAARRACSRTTRAVAVRRAAAARWST